MTDSNQQELMDIIVQGPYDDFTGIVAESYLNLPFVNNIVISCWEGNIVPKSIFDNPRISVVVNKYPFQNGTDNRNLQIVSSLGGVKKATAKHAAKMRADQLYSYDSMMKMYEYYINNQRQHLLFVAGMYPALLFHPRDNIFWGETQDLIRLFELPLEFNGLTDRVRINKFYLANYYGFFTRVETYIGAHYCAEFDERIKHMLIHPEKYLYDGAPLWHDAYNISQEVTSKFFKSFPRIGIDLAWPKKGWERYPYEQQHADYNECWAEEGY